eukprot:g2156.t1 g2156   contig11:832275-833207(-)
MVSFNPFWLSITILQCSAFSAGKGFSRQPNNNAFVSFDRFRSTCPSEIEAIRQFEPLLINDKANDDDVWVAVYRSNNNLPNVFVRDAFFDAMKTSTTAQGGDADTLVSSSSSSSSMVGGLGVTISSGNPKPVAVARLSKSSDSSNVSIIDSMRCALKKEDTNPDCDGGSEHTEAVGICIDELVLHFLQQCAGKQVDDSDDNHVRFDGGIRFRGTLVSGRLLEARGFREVSVLSSDMHSHESDYIGALEMYAERSTSKEVAKNPGSRDRALKIVSYLGRLDREVEKEKADDDDDSGRDFDPFASVKKYYST